jgi:arylsulfotransferase ASST
MQAEAALRCAGGDICWTVRRLLAAALVAIMACGDQGPTRPVEIPVASARLEEVDLSGPMPLLHVAVNAPVRMLTVTYWSDATGGYRVRASTDGSDAQSVSVPLPRVAAGRSYSYVLVATGGGDVVPDTVVGSFTAAELPPELADIQFEMSGQFTDPLTLVEIANSPTGYSGFVIVDRAGEIVWQWRATGFAQGSTRRANGNFVLNDAGNELLEVTPAGDVVHRLAAGAVPNVAAHHDVIPTPQNTLLFLSSDPQVHDDETIVGDAIWEWTPETGALAMRWSTSTSLDPDLDWSSWSLPEDWVHANSLALGPRGNVILSMRALHQVLSISRDWQRVEWRLGGPESTIEQVGDVSFGGQHTAQELPNGNVLMFDNRWEHVDGPNCSRLLELAIDHKHGTATPVWEYWPSPEIYAPIVGAAWRLDNGNTFGMFGTSAGITGVATGPVLAVEVNASSDVVGALTISNVFVAYRARPLDRLLDEEVIGADEIVAFR